MEYFILFAALVIIAGLIKALENSTPIHPRRGARALKAARPAGIGSTSLHLDTSDSFSALAMASYGDSTVDDHTRNTDSSTSWDAGANDCAPADSGSWDSGGGSDGGGCDSGGSD
jgi:hypothetical protein